MTMAMVMTPAKMMSVTKCRPNTTRSPPTAVPNSTAPPSAIGLSCGGARPPGAHLPKSLARLARHERAIPLAGAARAPPRLEGRRTGKLLHEIRARSAPVLLEQGIGGERWPEQERADQEHHDRGGHQHRRVGEDELAQEREYRRR